MFVVVVLVVFGGHVVARPTDRPTTIDDRRLSAGGGGEGSLEGALSAEQGVGQVGHDVRGGRLVGRAVGLGGRSGRAGGRSERALPGRGSSPEACGCAGSFRMLGAAAGRRSMNRDGSGKPGSRDQQSKWRPMAVACFMPSATMRARPSGRSRRKSLQQRQRRACTPNGGARATTREDRLVP